MSTNKNAYLRYQTIDKCLSDPNNLIGCTWQDLQDACQQALMNHSKMGNQYVDKVSDRQIKIDVKFLIEDKKAPIIKNKIKGDKKSYLKYLDKNYSINNLPITQFELNQLHDTLIMLNRFEGLPQFDILEDVLQEFQERNNIESDYNSFVSFEKARVSYNSKKYFSTLFNSIKNKQVLKINYSPSFCESAEFIIHPYFIKQYNNRWFLFGKCTHKTSESVKFSSKGIMQMALDRIDKIECSTQLYEPCEDEFFVDYFNNVVGVTVPEGEPIKDVLLKVDISRYNYISSKTLHRSQVEVKEMRSENSRVIRLSIIPNYEFYALLMQHADAVEVLEPLSVKQALNARIQQALDKNKL